MISAVLDMCGFLDSSETWIQWTILSKSLLQLIAQCAQFGHAGFDQFELVLQQSCDGAGLG